MEEDTGGKRSERTPIRKKKKKKSRVWLSPELVNR